jgi:signal transduction histidine kinase
MREEYTRLLLNSSVLDHLPPGLGWALVGVGAVIFVLVVRRFRVQARRLQERSRELEHLSTELIRVNKMKSEFLANVSHELRTPLNAIVGFVDLLREGVYGELTPKQAGPVQRIEASASHLRHLVDQILDLAKMAAGRLEIHSEPIDLRPFILDVASEVEPLVAEKSLYLSLAMSSALPRVRTDATHLRQIILNLLGNAVKYTYTGTISVRAKVLAANDPLVPTLVKPAQDAPASTVRPWIAIQVIDTGIGIGKNDQTRVFEEFEQINAGPRGDSMNRGTGLGLPISRRLARLLGGDVTVESELGKGSTFTIWLPGEASQQS